MFTLLTLLALLSLLAFLRCLGPRSLTSFGRSGDVLGGPRGFAGMVPRICWGPGIRVRLRGGRTMDHVGSLKSAVWLVVGSFWLKFP